MIAYRSVQKNSSTDNSASYRVSVDGQLLSGGSCAYMFNKNYTLNSPIVIGNNVTNCENMFRDCDIFNASVTIPNSVKNMAYMFISCDVFNCPIQIPDGAVNCNGLFSGTPYKQDIYVPASVMDIGYMCQSALSSEFNKSIYVKGNVYRNLQTKGLFYSSESTHLRKYVYFNVALNNRFNQTSNSLAGFDITWTSMTNGFYNSLYNIYCYYNYSG